MKTKGTGVNAARSILLFALFSATLLVGCGIGLDSTTKLDRSEQAFESGDYRASMIDAKDVLLSEPDNVRARLLLGRASVEAGEGVSAEKEFRRAIELGTAVGEVAVWLGRALLLQQKFDKFLEEIQPDLAKTDTDRLTLLRLRGDALIGLKRPVEARELYVDVLRVDAEDGAALLGVANSYIVERNLFQARETLNQVLQLKPNDVQAWLVSGALSLELQDRERAIADFEEALKLAQATSNSEAEIQALSGLGNSHLMLERLDDARVVLERMSEVDPTDARTILVGARLAMADHDWAKAQEGLREILSRYPDNKQAQMMLGIVHKESGNLEQAEMYLSAVVAGEPDNVMARRLLAETQLKLNKGREARQVLAPLITGADSDIGAILMAADVNLRLGNIDDAISLLERSVAADPGNLDLQLQLAFAYLRSGDTEKVQTLLREIPATANDDVNFRRACLSILTAMSQARSEDAINESRELLSRWPDRATAYRLAGSIAMATGDYLSARKSLRKALELEPDDIASLRFLAELDRLENDIESEKEGYESIIVTRPGDIRSMIALARLAMDAQQPDVAREWLEKARSADATSLSPRLLLGSMALEDEDFQEAETLAREAMKIDPNHSLAYSVLGFAQLGQGMFAEAEVSFGRALEIQPDEQSHRLNLSRSQAMRGNTELAMATLEEALDQSLHNVPSAAFLAFLKAKSGDMRGALEVATTLRDNLPGEAAPHALMAELHVTAGNSLAASSAYERALELENTSRYAVRAYQIRAEAGMSNQLNSLLDYLEERPFDADMRAYLAQAFHRLGDTGEAISQYERILIEDPGNYVVANNLAWHYFQAKDPRAEMIARQAYGLNPESGAVADTLGWILVSQGAVEDGISILRSAVKLADGEPEYRYHLAAGLSAAGRTSEARKLLLELLAGGDEFSSRREAEALLQTL